MVLGSSITDEPGTISTGPLPLDTCTLTTAALTQEQVVEEAESNRKSALQIHEVAEMRPKLVAVSKVRETDVPASLKRAYASTGAGCGWEEEITFTETTVFAGEKAPAPAPVMFRARKNCPDKVAEPDKKKLPMGADVD